MARPAQSIDLEKWALMLTLPQLLVSIFSSDHLNVLAMACVAMIGRYIVSINRVDADKIPARAHRRVAALTGFMAFVLGAFLIGANLGTFWARIGAAGFIALLDQAIALRYLSRAAGAAIPVFEVSHSTPKVGDMMERSTGNDTGNSVGGESRADHLEPIEADQNAG